MKGERKVKKMASRKPSTKRLRDLSNKDYTKRLVDDMIKALNRATQRGRGKGSPKKVT
jgi:hypothetical protein